MNTLFRHCCPECGGQARKVKSGEPESGWLIALGDIPGWLLLIARWRHHVCLQRFWQLALFSSPNRQHAARSSNRCNVERHRGSVRVLQVRAGFNFGGFCGSLAKVPHQSSRRQA